VTNHQPNVLLIMTDEERYPPPYEQGALAAFRRDHLPAHQGLRARSRELHRHYVGSTACVPSRATMFTGQYPSLHGVTNTDGLAKAANDPAMSFLDPDTVPTMGDWFRAAGHETHYRGKWHISHADLLVTDTHQRVRTNDGDGRVDPAAIELYERAARLEPFGFAGWVGREPHGAAKEDTGLVKLVDTAIMRIIDAFDASGMADDTIVVFTSDHGDLVGAHGGLVQKWHNAFDEAVRVPFMVSGAGIDPDDGGIDIPTSHVDLLPTLLGLAGIDREAAAAEVALHHIETQPLAGRDLSSLLHGRAGADALEAPIYFMTEDQVSLGLRGRNRLTQEPYEPVGQPAKVESVIASQPTGPNDSSELWKLNHYYERLPEWEETHGIQWHPPAGPPVEPQWELHNLSADPEERTNLAGVATTTQDELRRVLDTERDTERRVPTHRNPV